MAKNGRPSLYSDELADRICDEVAAGRLLPQVCKKPGMPHVATVFRWLIGQEPQHKRFRDNYERAKEIQCEVFAAETLELAHRPLPAKKFKTFTKGATITTEETSGDAVERARLAVDTRKWWLSHVFPKKYGKRLQIETGSGDQDESQEALRQQARKFFEQKKTDA